MSKIDGRPQRDLGDPLEACAREPIHIPGAIQPHGALMVLDDALAHVLQASSNLHAFVGVPGDGPEWRAWLARLASVVRPRLTALPGPDPSFEFDASGRRFHVAMHAGAQGVVLEFEEPPAQESEFFATLYPSMRAFVDQLESSQAIEALCTLAAAEVRRITGFNRVMVYRFDPKWHGTVIAEDGDGVLPSYLGLRFPASDIPAQARALYRRNRLRLIPDARYVPVAVAPDVSPIDGRPLDLSDASLRSVSPIHLQYMRNMGTAASMSISILIDGELWGLISCHHAAARLLGPRLRSICDFVGQLVALQIGARERGAHADERLALGDKERLLLAQVLRAPSLRAGLKEANGAWLEVTHAAGAALVMDESILTAGRTPTEAQITSLATWLAQSRRDDSVYATDALGEDYPPARAFDGEGAGVIAIPISSLHPHYILWFRPEVVRTVRWGGAPVKEVDARGALNPRQSFATWAEEVRGTAEPWSRAQRDAAQSFMHAIVSHVLKRAEERAELTKKLEESNHELEAFSYSVSHDLRAPFRHVVGYAQLLRERDDVLDERARHYLSSIIDSANAAGVLVDDLLTFSQLGRSNLDLGPIDMDKMAAELRKSFELDACDRQVQWQIEALPAAYGDGNLVRQALSNLVDNALKYTRDRDVARIQISGEDRAHETVYSVRDNGVGFDMRYVNKLFGVFQRLHRVEEFEGTGIGLALARRIVDRHGGWIAAEGQPDVGAVFRFGLPKRRDRLGDAA